MMKTNGLIRALAADHPSRSASLERTLCIATACALALAAVLFATVLGPRADIATAVTEPRFIFKFIVTLALAVSAGALVLRLARPGARVPWLWLAAGPALLAASLVVELAVTPPASWPARTIGTNARICLTMVPLLSIAPLAAALLTLRHGAPTRPALAGAVAGLLAGGLAATLYAAHCTDDSPLFVATWYTLAIALVALAGALIGWRVLRW